MDMMILSLNFVNTASLVTDIDIHSLRVVESILCILQWFKFLYFMQLLDDIAPYVNIIFVIFNDIQYFMAVFVIALIAFTNAFYLIGRNQLSYTQEGEDAPSYSSLIGAAHHVYTSSLGEFDTQAYFDNDMSPILACLFICLSFFMCIHLLNMLIAIMGESFSKNSKVAEAEIKIS